MKNQNLLYLAVVTSILFLSSCQTAPKATTATFPEFQILKMKSDGIEVVTIKPAMANSESKGWPEVKVAPIIPLPSFTKNLKIAVIGDTGCRLKEFNGVGTYQNCSQTKEWPFSETVKALNNEIYDFGIHTGDYHYREACTDPKVCTAITKSSGFGWEAWWDDFYSPAQTLFKKSPWIFVRGNHEDCQRAFAGWAPLSAEDKKFTDTCNNVEPYQWTELDDVVFINFDNSSMEDRKEIKAADAAIWKEKFIQIKNRIGAMKVKKEIWFLTHKPMFGYFPNPVDAEPKALEKNMSNLLKESGLYDQIDIFLAGHVHTQQVVPLKNKLQLIVAHSGTSLDPFGRKIMGQDVMTTTENKYSFGYAIFEKLGFKKWRFVFKDTSGKSQMECDYEKNKVQCE